ncbi:MAG: sulfotransferase domain-containing protein [Deinococcota bacterium]
MCAFRNPKDAFISFYRFFENYFFEPDSISLEELFQWRWPRDSLAEKGYWQHLRSWWEQRTNEDVLLFCYEDMKADLAGTIKRIAHFMGIDLDDDLFEIVLNQSSREFMLAHKEKFGELPLRQHAYKLGILPLEGEGHKITPGASAKYQLSKELERALDKIWEEQIYAPLGIKDYASLRDALAQPRTS